MCVIQIDIDTKMESVCEREGVREKESGQDGEWVMWVGESERERGWTDRRTKNICNSETEATGAIENNNFQLSNAKRSCYESSTKNDFKNQQNTTG